MRKNGNKFWKELNDLWDIEFKKSLPFRLKIKKWSGKIRKWIEDTINYYINYKGD